MRRGLLTIHAADFVHVHGLVNADVLFGAPLAGPPLCPMQAAPQFKLS